MLPRLPRAAADAKRAGWWDASGMSTEQELHGGVHEGHHDTLHEAGKCSCSSVKDAPAGGVQSFGTNDTGKAEVKEWIDGLSDDE